jgi:hypothetical protein
VVVVAVVVGAGVVAGGGVVVVVVATGAVPVASSWRIQPRRIPEASGNSTRKKGPFRAFLLIAVPVPMRVMISDGDGADLGPLVGVALDAGLRGRHQARAGARVDLDTGAVGVTGGGGLFFLFLAGGEGDQHGDEKRGHGARQVAMSHQENL